MNLIQGLLLLVILLLIIFIILYHKIQIKNYNEYRKDRGIENE